MANRILVVCVGNICRSPMAEAILRHRLPQEGCVVGSAGLVAVEGSALDPLAEAVLVANGLTGKGHVARQVDPSLVENADLVLTMERRHVAALQAIFPACTGKTFLLGKWQRNADIADPYGHPRPAFEHTYRMIDTAVASWCARLERY